MFGSPFKDFYGYLHSMVMIESLHMKPLALWMGMQMNLGTIFFSLKIEGTNTNN
jgi:hypothetical protein